MNRALKLKMMDSREEVQLELARDRAESAAPRAQGVTAPRSHMRPIDNPTPHEIAAAAKGERFEKIQSRARPGGDRSQIQKGWGRDYEPRLHLVPQLVHGASTADATGNPTNIWFNWNGHSWCAFEVLGVPQASSVARAQDAFRQAISESSPDAHPFLNEAIQAIERCCK